VSGVCCLGLRAKKHETGHPPPFLAALTSSERAPAFVKCHMSNATLHVMIPRRSRVLFCMPRDPPCGCSCSVEEAEDARAALVAERSMHAACITRSAHRYTLDPRFWNPDTSLWEVSACGVLVQVRLRYVML
jgi:hypothetical protein